MEENKVLEIADEVLNEAEDGVSGGCSIEGGNIVCLDCGRIHGHDSLNSEIVCDMCGSRNVYISFIAG
jgi:hypothetical protein